LRTCHHQQTHYCNTPRHLYIKLGKDNEIIYVINKMYTTTLVTTFVENNLELISRIVSHRFTKSIASKIWMNNVHSVFEPPEALLIHTLSKVHYLIHKLYLTNLISFLKLLNCGTHCHQLLSLNPKICHLLNQTSLNLILSPFLLKLSLIFSAFSFVGAVIDPTAFPRQ